MLLATPSAPVLWAWVGVAAFWDLRTRRIPNHLIVIGLVLSTVHVGITGDWLQGLGGIGTAFGVGIIPFALRILGGGDVKALMVVGGFVGVTGVAKLALWTAAGCGLLAAIYWASQRFRAAPE
ncbi:MAG: prepilin peptidase, partial [Myxococcota bacterium]